MDALRARAPQRFWPYALFLAVAAFLALSADTGLGFGPDQIAYNLGAQDLIDDWRGGDELRNEFGSAIRQSFMVLHGLGIGLLGGAAASYRLVLFLSALAYLVAMYLLLAQVLENRVVAALVAVVTIAQRYTIGTSFWGMGEFQSILPRIAVLPIFPLAWLLLERYRSEARALLAFLLVALGFGLHLSTVYFYAVLLLTYGLWILWTRGFALLPNLVVASALPIFALVGLPGPMWSRKLERAPELAALVALGGIALFVLHSVKGRRWTGIPVLLYLVVSSLVFVKTSSVAGYLGKKTSRREAAVAKKDAAPVSAERVVADFEAAEPDVHGAGSPSAASSEPSPPAMASPADPRAAVSAEPPARAGGRKAAGRADPGADARRSPRPPPEKRTAAEPKGPRPGVSSPPAGPPPPAADSAAASAPAPAPTAARSDVDLVNEALYARFGWALFPISLATLAFALFNAGLPGLLALWEAVRRWRRGLEDRERLTLLLALSVLVVSLGLTGALQLYSRWTGRPDIVLELFRAFRFIFLPIYLFMGLFLARVWDEVRDRPARWRLGWVALLVALAIPPRQALAAMPDGLKLWARGLAASSGSLHEGDPSQEKYLRMLLATDEERAEDRRLHRDFVELCAWVRESTPETAVFMTTDYDFLHEARREIRISYAQGAGSARSFAKQSGYRGWHQAYTTITSAFASGSPERIMAAARRYEVDYVVIEGDEPVLPATRVFANRGYSLYALSPSG